MLLPPRLSPLAESPMSFARSHARFQGVAGGISVGDGIASSGRRDRVVLFLVLSRGVLGGALELGADLELGGRVEVVQGFGRVGGADHQGGG
jgi:hypothetical protein